MTKLQDSQYLQEEQYHSADKLNARITLHRRFSTNEYGWFRWVFDHFRFHSNAKILELGCGPGDLWKENVQRIPLAWDITLSDFSRGMVIQARDNLTERLDRYSFGVINAEDIPFAAQQFDVVIANHFLYHVPNRQKAFSEIQRVLKQGGLIFASTIGERHLEEISDLLVKFDSTLEDVFKSDERPFTLENGSQQLQDWFDILNVDRYPDSLQVTETRPLAVYLLSTVLNEQIQGKEVQLMSYLEEQMAAEDGVIQIKKVSGLITGVRR